MAHHHQHKTSPVGLAALLNLVFAVSEFIAGLAFNSTALLSDAVHDLGDVLVLFLSALIEKLSHKKPTQIYTYGFGRLSLMAAVFNSVILLTGLIFVIGQAVSRLFNPEPVSSLGMFIMSILGIGVNLWAVLKMKGQKTILERSVLLHLAEDLLGWVAVFLTSIVIYLTGWYILDPIISLGIAAFIAVNVIRNLSQSYRMVMMGTSNPEDFEKISQEILGLDGVLGLTDSHYWSIDGEKQIFTAKVRVATTTDTDRLRQRIDKVLEPYTIACSTIEFISHQSPDTKEVL